MENEVTKGQIWLGILLVFLMTAGFFIGDYMQSKKDSKPEDVAQIVDNIVKEINVTKPVCANDTAAAEELRQNGQVVKLAENFNSYGKEGSFVHTKISLVKSFGSGSQVACGYLYVKASARNEALKLDWEHPYVNPAQFGGHLENDSAISIKGNDTTELLYDLSNMKYRTTVSSSEVLKADWAALLNVADRVKFEIALNTLDSKGTLEEVSIIYKCWNPETGKVTTDCRLEAEAI